MRKKQILYKTRARNARPYGNDSTMMQLLFSATL